ncbi:MAG: site-specific integrase [Cyanobacteria bacterium P01_D01_bin.50]
MKINRHGQATVLSESDYSKIRKQVISPKYKLLIDFAWFTGERIGALSQIKINDVYSLEKTPREYITFQAQTRKASPDGKRRTRQLIMHSTLQENLQNYQPDFNCAWLFPNRDGANHISVRWLDRILRSAVDKASLTAKGISWHSFRRTFATRLHKNGVAIYTISKILGHTDVRTTQRYVEVNEDQMKGAIEAL